MTEVDEKRARTCLACGISTTVLHGGICLLCIWTKNPKAAAILMEAAKKEGCEVYEKAKRVLT